MTMDKMTFEEFLNYVKDAIKGFLPDKYQDCNVAINEVLKNNDTKLHALTVSSPEGNVAPTIYMEQFYADYKDGQDISDVLEEIARVRVDHEVGQDMDVSHIMDYSQVENRITARLINAEKNAEYLADKPHKVVDDLAVVYSINLGEHEGGTMSVAVTNNLLENYGVTVDELHEAALRNMDELSQSQFKSMGQVMMEMMGEDFPQEMLPPDDGAMFILSNSSKLFGASALLDKKVMDDISQKLGDFYILPSSVHETIIVPKRAGVELNELENMVQEVNSTQVAENEQLSDHVYAYDAETHELYRADKEAEHQMLKQAEKAVGTAEKGDIKPQKAEDKSAPAKKPSVLAKLEESKKRAAEMAKAAPARDMGHKRDATSLA